MHNIMGYGVIVTVSKTHFIVRFSSGFSEQYLLDLLSGVGGTFRNELDEVSRRLRQKQMLHQARKMEMKIYSDEKIKIEKQNRLRPYQSILFQLEREMAEIKELVPFVDAIKRYDMLDIWGGGVGEDSENIKLMRATSKAIKARDQYLRILHNRDEFSIEFQDWAIKKALGLRTSKKYTAQPTGGQNWRLWGSREYVAEQIDEHKE